MVGKPHAFPLPKGGEDRAGFGEASQRESRIPQVIVRQKGTQIRMADGIKVPAGRRQPRSRPEFVVGGALLAAEGSPQSTGLLRSHAGGRLRKKTGFVDGGLILEQ